MANFIIHRKLKPTKSKHEIQHRLQPHVVLFNCKYQKTAILIMQWLNIIEDEFYTSQKIPFEKVASHIQKVMPEIEDMSVEKFRRVARSFVFEVYKVALMHEFPRFYRKIRVWYNEQIVANR